MTPPKKIILISLDTLRADHMGCYGYPRNTSPTLDTLANEGILFKNAFSPSSFTIPAHASIFTGKYPSHHSIGFNQINGKLNGDIDITLAEILKSQNFSTAGFVSSIILRKETNFNLGFDVYDDNQTSHELNRPEVLKRNCTDTTQRAINWLEKNFQDDFYIFLHYMDIHGAYNCPSPYNEMFINDRLFGEQKILNSIVSNENPIGGIPEYQVLKAKTNDNGKITTFENDVRYYLAQYDGCIRYLDDNIGLLFERLRKLEVYEDTFIIITSDHGEAFGENNIYFYHGLTVTPEQIQVPFIIKPHKELNMDHNAVEIPVSTIDILPTVLEICDYNYNDFNLDGQSLLSVMINPLNSDIRRKDVLISENEYQYANVYNNKYMKFFKKNPQTKTYYPCVQTLIDSLDGKIINFVTKNGSIVDHISPDVCSLPFDVYTKNFLVRKMVLNLPKKIIPISILDVGGRSGQLSVFFPEYEVYVIDIQLPEIENSTNFVKGSAITLPFKDNSFPVVVSLDVLEHVPKHERKALMNELARVSSDYIIIGAPFKSPEVEYAEKVTNNLYLKMTGKSHPMLIEHIEQGLPEAEIFENWLNTKKFSFEKIGSNNIECWLLLELLLLFSHKNEISPRDKSALLEHYNTEFMSMGDLLEPTYRKMYLISKKQMSLPQIFDQTPHEANMMNRLKLINCIYICIYNNAKLWESHRIQLLSSINSKDIYIKDLIKSNKEKDQYIESLQETIITKIIFALRVQIENIKNFFN